MAETSRHAAVAPGSREPDDAEANADAESRAKRTSMTCRRSPTPSRSCAHLDVSGRFHRDSPIGRLYHRGMVSLRENVATESLQSRSTTTASPPTSTRSPRWMSTPTAALATRSVARCCTTSPAWPRISSRSCAAVAAIIAASSIASGVRRGAAPIAAARSEDLGLERPARGCASPDRWTRSDCGARSPRRSGPARVAHPGGRSIVSATAPSTRRERASTAPGSPSTAIHRCRVCLARHPDGRRADAQPQSRRDGRRGASPCAGSHRPRVRR